MQRIANRSTSDQSPERTRGGFTLIEILIVIAIIMVIAAMAVPQLIGTQEKAMIRTSKATVSNITNAVKMYAVDYQDQYPEGSQDVWDTLLKEEKHQGVMCGPYIEEPPKDAWGKVLFYKYPPKHNAKKPDIWSGGPNGEDDGGGPDTDDIGNWPVRDE